MGLMEKLKFGWDAGRMIYSLLEEWEPKGCKTERDFENSLYKYLHKQLEEVQVTRQFARGRVRADIEVGGRVIIELKHNLTKTAQFHRLVGQLESYKEWEGNIIVVLCGETDPNLLKEVKARIKKLIDHVGEECDVIQKVSA